MKLINYTITALLLLALGYITWLYFNPKIEKVFIQIKPQPQIVYVEKKGGGSIATVPIRETNTMEEVLPENYLKYVNDTLKPALKEGLRYKTEVTKLTRVIGVLQDSLSKKNIVVNAVKSDLITWKTKYIEISANAKDSTAKYTYNAQLDIAEYNRRKNLFSKKEQVIAISSPDKNLKINGVDNFTKTIKPKKDILQLNLKVQGLYLNKILIPYGGAELLFNPDGKLKPVAGYGYFYDNNSGRFYPYWSMGVQLNLIRL